MVLVLLKKLYYFFSGLLRQNGLLWAVHIVSLRFTSLVRSSFAASALNAPGIFLGGDAKIRGARSIKFGKDIHIGGRVWIEAVTNYAENEYNPAINIGDAVCFSEGVHISCIESVVVGNNVLLGSHVYISDHGHGDYSGLQQANPETPPSKRKLGGGGHVLIEDNVWIGDNVVVIGPVTIGRGAVIGANAVVCKDIPAATIAVGAPAKVIKFYDGNSQKWLKV